jgi:hypothetical protein
VIPDDEVERIATMPGHEFDREVRSVRACYGRRQFTPLERWHGDAEIDPRALVDYATRNGCSIPEAKKALGLG